MIRSTKTTLKFANDGKQNDLSAFILEYRNLVDQYIDIIWPLEKVSTLLPLTITSQAVTWLSARMRQCAGKQASAIVRGTKKKYDQRLWRINEFHKNGDFKSARRLKRKLTPISRPSVEFLKPELDSRFIKVDFESDTSFDGWITIGSIGNKQKFVLPFKKHKHFLEMEKAGKPLSGCRISETMVTFMFDIPEQKNTSEAYTIGIDVGLNATISTSDGQIIDSDKHGHSYHTICEKLARKQKGSKGFQKTQTHRTNYLGWSVNQLDLSGVTTVHREKLYQVRYGKNTSKLLKAWNYAELFDKLDARLEKTGVQLLKINPTYTSQRCFQCGWVLKGNRIGRDFRCQKCLHSADADFNASQNISLHLPPIGDKERLLQKNRKGFYWFAVGQESIVPVAQKTFCHKSHDN